MGKEHAIRLIHLLEICHVVEEYVDLPPIVLADSFSSNYLRIEHTLTTLSMPLPAASRMAMMLLQHAAVLSPMFPSTSLPSAVPGICPETQIVPPATTA